MTQIIAFPADLFDLARSRKSAAVIVLPHAYEAVQSLRKMGSQYQFIKAAPSIAGKLALLSLEGGMETDEDLELFSLLSPACGVKNGRIVNTTNHALPFADKQLQLSVPITPVSKRVSGYIMQRAGNEWYYYEDVGSIEQRAILGYIHGLAVLNSSVGGVK